MHPRPLRAGTRPEPGAPAPTVSVVIAAYNRAHLLRIAVRSVLAQSFEDFEVLVVGDACTDDSEQAVTDLGDARVRFVNLAINIGDQSGPNNVGIAQARGLYVAFLNQDDLWLPDHLEVCRAWIEATGADLVHALAARISVGTATDDPTSWTAGMAPGQARFDPARDFAACSTWLVRAAVFERIGPFRTALECVIEPTQDLLFRAWHAGLVHRQVPNLSVVIIPSGERAGSYLNRDASEHEAVLAVLSRPGGRMEVLSRIPSLPTTRPRRLADAAVAALLRPLGRLGIPPRMLRLGFARRFRRGAIVQGLRAIRGLDPIWHGRDVLTALRLREAARLPTYALGTTVRFGIEGDGGRYRERGWCSPESGGVWTGDETAALLFALPEAAEPEDLRLDLQVAPFTPLGHARQRLGLLIDGTVVFEGSLAGGETLPPIPVPAAARRSGRLLRLTLHLPDARSPRSLGLSDDVRRLGLYLIGATLSVADGAEPAPAPIPDSALRQERGGG
ncbi:MAG: glycosyltransferase family 2 protein [Methylorubrum rhodinum]|uniref:glycosyltransferase family 2 protein n=1 Tax=Methylorubrum rhodinum TaxID=29428 RepID=UPI003BAEBBC1